MTIDRAVGLTRAGGGPQRATLLELFLDLVFVAALALTSRSLAQRLDAVGVFQTVLLLMAIWWVWSVTALTTDLYHRQRPPIFAVTLWVMLGTILMAGTLPEAFSDHALTFAGAYVAIHLGRGIFLVAALHGRTARLHASRFIFWFVLSAVPWLAGGLVPGWARGDRPGAARRRAAHRVAGPAGRPVPVPPAGPGPRRRAGPAPAAGVRPAGRGARRGAGGRHRRAPTGGPAVPPAAPAGGGSQAAGLLLGAPLALVLTGTLWRSAWWARRQGDRPVRGAVFGAALVVGLLAGRRLAGSAGYADDRPAWWVELALSLCAVAGGALLGRWGALGAGAWLRRLPRHAEGRAVRRVWAAAALATTVLTAGFLGALFVLDAWSADGDLSMLRLLAAREGHPDRVTVVTLVDTVALHVRVLADQAPYLLAAPLAAALFPLAATGATARRALRVGAVAGIVAAVALPVVVAGAAVGPATRASGRRRCAVWSTGTPCCP
ncbi:low temperature requirement protein A [Micromonospora sp. MA102]|uniref:low temperature requirement protein A n=1 Tax=Micromonospora sp. MA102 TaxID=2952755 RepID=UPI0021C935B6|nr:low temperature requirement protein A [Micromonospora sp. MA102]